MKLRDAMTFIMQIHTRPGEMPTITLKRDAALELAIDLTEGPHPVASHRFPSELLAAMQDENEVVTLAGCRIRAAR
jgi:hypothetical protein